jgi:glyoxylase-like metal-dependent hydrolase (beta-lactamase superfamily II)
VNAVRPSFRPHVALGTAVATAALTAVIGAQQPVALVPLDPPPPPLVVDGLEVLPVQGQVFMITGAGGNVTLQVGSEGVLVVDSGATGQTDKLLSAIGRLTTRQVRFLVNTSADPDHVAGNRGIVQAHGGVRGPRPGGVGGGNPLGQNFGVMTMSHENAYNRMSTPQGAFPALTGEGLPESTFFTPRKEFFSNGEAVQLYAQPNAHSDGDLMVFFRKSDVVATGDVFVTSSYPVIDTARGGSIDGVVSALNNILDLTVPERNQMGGTRVIPGHGRICNEADVVDYRDMVTIIRDRVQAMVKKGMSLAQIKGARVSLEYDGLYGATSGPWTTDMFLDAVYRGVGGK